METERYSFLKNIFGRDTYEVFKEKARKYVSVAAGILLLVFLLSLFFHWGFLSTLIDLTFGTSLIFLLFTICVIILFDKGITIKVEYDSFSHQYIPPTKKPEGYTWTVVWGCTLIAIGIVLIYATQKYKYYYGFGCDTFLVDKNSGIYHVDGIDCEEASHSYNLEKMQGYEFQDAGYHMCEECVEWLEDAESAYNESRYRRP